MLSQTAEHALRAVLYLARQEGEDPVPAARVASALGAPSNYLGKTLHALARAGIVEGVRGPAGGYRLRIDPAGLSLHALIGAVDEEPSARAVCLLGDRPCNEREPCRAHRAWTDVRSAHAGLLRGTTVADLLHPEPETPSVPGPHDTPILASEETTS